METLPYKAKASIEYINDVVKDYETKIAELNKQIAFLTNVPKNKPLLPYKYHSLKIKETRRNSWGLKDELVYLVSSEDLVKFQLEDMEIHKKNLEIIAENSQTQNTLMRLLQSFGLEKTKLEYKSGRSSKRVEITRGWVSDVSALFSTYNPVANVEYLYRDVLEEVKNHEQLQITQRREAKEKEVNLQKEKDYKMLVVSLVKKYNLPDEAALWDANVLTEEIAKKNKYLYLAQYLSKNRVDWSDGYSYAEIGMNNFTVENQMDAEIMSELSSLTRDWDGDGRVFRDCKWNYNVLFEIATKENKELSEDYGKISSHETHL